MEKETPEIIIDRITTEEALEGCANLLVDAYNGEPWNDNWTKEKALEKLICFFNSPRFMGWVAMKGNQAVGCCVGNIEPYFTGDYFYLKEMFVPGEFQRSGIGSKMMEKIKGHLELTGIKTVILFTSNHGFPFTFWQQQGFEEMPGMRMMGFGDSE